MAKKRGESALQPGMRIGYLTVIDQSSDWQKWNCMCRCGNIVVRDYSSLTRAQKKGALSSCGCLLQHRNLDRQINIARQRQLYYTRRLSHLLELKLLRSEQKANNE